MRAGLFNTAQSGGLVSYQALDVEAGAAIEAEENMVLGSNLFILVR